MPRKKVKNNKIFAKTASPSASQARAPGENAGAVQLQGRLWLSCGEATFLSWGRICLLEKIKETNSLTAAARQMQMSYSHAWNLVQQMNRLAGKPLVESHSGGSSGGGTYLTAAGEQAVGAFWKLIKDFQGWLRQQDLAALKY